MTIDNGKYSSFVHSVLIAVAHAYRQFKLRIPNERKNKFTNYFKLKMHARVFSLGEERKHISTVHRRWNKNMTVKLKKGE